MLKGSYSICLPQQHKLMEKCANLRWCSFWQRKNEVIIKRLVLNSDIASSVVICYCWLLPLYQLRLFSLYKCWVSKCVCVAGCGYASVSSTLSIAWWQIICSVTEWSLSGTVAAVWLRLLVESIVRSIDYTLRRRKV